VAEGAARIDAVALEPVPAARAEPRALAVSELAIRPLQQKPQTHTERKRESDQPPKPTNGSPSCLQQQLSGAETQKTQKWRRRTRALPPKGLVAKD